MPWKRLDHHAQLAEIAEASAQRPQLIFKHSTRCSISAAAKHRMEMGLDQLTQQFDVYFLDLIMHRDVSNEVANRFATRHESPQVLVIDHGNTVVNITHYDISPDAVLQQAAAMMQRRNSEN